VRRLVLVIAVASAALWVAPGAFAAGWCGTGEPTAELPDATTGPQIHAVWAVPADGPDTFAAGAGKIADDVASVVSWWQGQDPTRVPRFDTAVFPGGTCLDISFVRLPLPGAAYSGAGAAFDAVEQAVATAGFGNAFKRYLVYYDGPSVQTNICGTGGGNFDTGPGYAIVWLQGCPSVPTDSIAAHELLHALGALPAGAPHACPGATGHPCDSSQDVLYPYNSGLPLAQLYLDYNHDDYYAHSGSWPDIQDSAWLHLLAGPVFPVALTVAGAGTVSSDEPGIVCSASCTTQWDGGSRIQLDPIPARGARFVGWSGACTGRDTCGLTVQSATSVAAAFGPSRVRVSVRTSGKGAVRCTPRCGTTIAGGSALTLRAVAAKGWRFASWSGDCAGVHIATCRPRTDYHVVARAIFRRR
jgi:Divergent InlB B-repeat domain